MHKLFQLVLFAMLFICNASVADVIVRMEIQQGAVIDNVDFRLYDGEAPVTVANFLNYVNDGDYDKSFIHRNVPGFVVQAGGFTFDPALNDGSFSNDPLINDYPGGLQPVPTDPPIVNEFNRPNLRGTVAMAKVAAQFVEGGSCTVEGPGCTLIPGTGPDSATSQWFINLVDNSTSLDVDNGGYTVFGEVLNDGMAAIDTVASQPIYDRTDIHGAFGELPLVNYSSDPILGTNLVQVNSITELFTITSDINYGIVTSGSSVQPEITIQNTGNDILQIGSIGDINPAVEPFRIFDPGCANSILQPGDQCSFMVLFSPDSVGVYTDSFNVEIVNEISYEVSLRGEGGPAIDEPDILVSFSSVNFGVVDVLDGDMALPYTFNQIVQNEGKLDLEISSIDIIQNSTAEISISGNCIELSPLSTGSNCLLSIEFTPLTPGDKYAEISIMTNDPDLVENPFIIPIRGTAVGEDDGVPAAVEDAGPNNGDGNNDGILDSKQSNVATLIDSYGNYVTYLTDNTFRFRNMSALMPAEVPTDFVIGSGIFDFTVEGVVPGQLLEVGIILPAGMIPGAYYMYGPTAVDPVNHWFEYDFDGETGALMFGNVTFTTSSGSKFTRSVLKVIIKDGGRGDADQTVNGIIAVTSAMPINQDSGGSGSISFLQLLYLTSMLILTRRYARVRSF